MQLRMDCAIDPPLNPAGRLTAIWTAESEQKWRLNYHNGKDGNGVIERFTWVVETAAARLGFAGNGSEDVSFWLDRIKRDAPVAYLQTFAIRRGQTDEVYSVEILDICGLSADYCWKCEADEIRSRSPFAIASGELPDLAPDAVERIAEVLEDARPLVAGNSNEVYFTEAMALYLDALAWEYVLSQPSAVFEVIISGICARAREEFAGDLGVSEDRKQYWIRECRERVANGISGSNIPICVASHQVQVFRKFQRQFKSLAREKGELHVVFFDAARFNIFSDSKDATADTLHRTTLEQLARQAMSALNFKFGDPSRAIFYWLELLKPGPLFKQWKIDQLCLASATFCGELQTRAAAASIGPSVQVPTSPDQLPLPNLPVSLAHDLKIAVMDARILLYEELHLVWTRCFPAELPTDGSGKLPIQVDPTKFFPPFVAFGVRYYDAYARALLRLQPSFSDYEGWVNFALKRLACDELAPCRLDDGRHQRLSQWQQHMGATWRLFAHPNYVDLFPSAKELINALENINGPAWGSFSDALHNALSRRTLPLLAEGLKRLRPVASPPADIPGHPSPAAGTPSLKYPKRAQWLADRLRERSWNKHDLSSNGGPDHQTGQKVLDGKPVRADVLEKISTSLSIKYGKVNVLEIPID